MKKYWTNYKVACIVLNSLKIILVNQCTMKKPFNNNLLIPYFISYPTESFYYKIRDFLQHISYADFVSAIALIKSSSLSGESFCSSLIFVKSCGTALLIKVLNFIKNDLTSSTATSSRYPLIHVKITRIKQDV